MQESAAKAKCSSWDSILNTTSNPPDSDFAVALVSFDAKVIDCTNDNDRSGAHIPRGPISRGGLNSTIDRGPISLSIEFNIPDD